MTDYSKIPLRAANAVRKDLGISKITLWRWRKAGWINSVTIIGKVYIDMDSLNAFMDRAKTGEFEGQLHGAAAKSHEKAK